MPVPSIPLYQTLCDESDVRSVNAVLRRGSFWSSGPEIAEFESALARYVGRQHGVAFNSGTSALFALLHAYGLRADDEAIVPSFTFVSTAMAPLLVGARPVFADVEEKTYGLATMDVRRKITPRTRAIILMHYGGQAAEDTAAIATLAREKKIFLIEDAAESMGALLGGRQAGSFGDAALLSFCANKVISTGEGGAIVTDSAAIAERLRSFRSYGRVEPAPSDPPDRLGTVSPYRTEGHNLRLSSMQAALGLSQLKKIESVIDLRRSRAARLTRLLEGLPLKTPYEPAVADNRHVYQLYTIELPDLKTRDGLGAHLLANGIAAKVYFPPLHLFSPFAGRHTKVPSLPVTEKLAQRVLSLPIYPTLTDAQCASIATAVRSYFQRKA